MKSPAAFPQELDVGVAVGLIAEDVEAPDSALRDMQGNSRKDNASDTRHIALKIAPDSGRS